MILTVERGYARGIVQYEKPSPSPPAPVFPPPQSVRLPVRPWPLVAFQDSLEGPQCLAELLLFDE